MNTRALAVLALLFVAVPVAAAWPPSRCDHVKVLGSGDKDQVSWRFDEGTFAEEATLRDARQSQLDVLGEALDLLPDILCQAVRRVAFVDRPKRPGVSGWSTSNDRQDLVYLNAALSSVWNDGVLQRVPSARAEAIHRLVHESTHAAVRLIQSQATASPLGSPLQQRPDPDLWPGDVQALAQDLIARLRLDGGVMREWQRMHDSFAEHGFAAPYYGDEWEERDGVSHQSLVQDGFATAYGGDNPIEDLAEIASWALVRHLLPQGGPCAVLRSHPQSDIPREMAAVYTKLGFAQSLGFVDQAAFDGCVGKLRIRGSGDGFHSFPPQSSAAPHSYTSAVAGRIGAIPGRPFWRFELSAGGHVAVNREQKAARTVLQLVLTDAATPLQQVSFPRGLYRVAPGVAGNSLRILLTAEDDKPAVELFQGWVLVSRASHDLIEGSVFWERLVNRTSLLPVPEPAREIGAMTFRKE